MALSCKAQENSTTGESTTGDILDPSSIQGSYTPCSGSACWGQLSGGQIPNYNPQDQTVYWGYGGGILSWTTAINTALEQAGFQVDGYNYNWYVKNFDVNVNQNDGDDYLRISVRIYNESGNELYGKQFNLDGYYGWKYFSGTERFNDSIPAEDIDRVTIRAEGDDIGYWAGWYGPELDVNRSSVNLIYSPLPQDPCDNVPVTDPTCPNYVTPGLEDTLAITIQDNTFSDNTGDVVIDPVTELTQPNQEVADETVTEEPVGGLADNSNQSSQGTDQEKSGGGELSEAQKNALSAASAEANAAEQIASASSAASIAIGDAANESAVSTTLQNSAAMNSASQSMSSSSGNQQNSSGSQNGSSDGSSSDLSFMGIAQLSGSGNYSGEPSLELSITVTDDAAVSGMSDIVQSILKETFKKIQEQSKESSTAGIIQKPSDDPAEDQKLAMMQNPDIAQYQQSFLPDAAGYDDKEIYQGQKVIDNPAGRFFNGASDQLHRKMVREQYDR